MEESKKDEATHEEVGGGEIWEGENEEEWKVQGSMKRVLGNNRRRSGRWSKRGEKSEYVGVGK